MASKFHTGTIFLEINGCHVGWDVAIVLIVVDCVIDVGTDKK